MVRLVTVLAALLCLGTLGCEKLDIPALSTAEVVVGNDTTQVHAMAGAGNQVELSPAARKYADIQVEPVQFRQTKSLLAAMGKVLAPQPRTAIVGYAFSGRIAEVLVKPGDWVERGQPVIVLQSHEVGQSESDFYKALADLELAQLNYDREKELLEQGIGIKKNFVAAEAALKIAEASHEAAEKKLHMLGFTEQQIVDITETHRVNPTIELQAPITGRIVASSAVLGGFVDESVEILRVIDTTTLCVDAGIYEKDIAKVQVGQKVEIRVPAYPEEVFQGSVSYVSSLVDESTRTITVRAEVNNRDFRLKPGMFANVDILLNGQEEALVVPENAVLQDGDRQIVFVDQDGSYHRREVTTGPIDGSYQAIVSGLQEGERVVVQGNYQLRSVLLSDTLQAEHTH